MNTTDGITKRLMDQSDCRLRDEIEKAAKPFFAFLNDGQPHRFITSSTEKAQPVEVYYRETVRALKELAFVVNQKNRQENAIAMFMSRVEKIESDLNELRESIPQ